MEDEYIRERVEEMTDEELDAEVGLCYKEIAFWSIDFGSPDGDAVTEANLFIKTAQRQLKEIREEIKRRKGVTE